MHETMQRIFDATKKSPNELALAINVAPQSITNWSKRGISKSGAIAVAEKFGMSFDWIFTGNGQTVNKANQVTEKIDPSSRIWLPLMDISFSCGNGVDIDCHFEETKKKLAFEPDFLSNRGIKEQDVRLLYANGDSMEEFIYDGDIFAIDISDTSIRDGQIYAVYFEGEAMLKQIFKEAGGKLILHSKNPKYKDKIVTEDNGADFKVLGRQFWRAG